MATQMPVTLDTPISIRVAMEGSTRRVKVPLRDLGANVFETKLRSVLNIPTNQKVVFERYSDSAGTWAPLDSSNTQAYKTLFRAAKAKLKLRLRAVVVDSTTGLPELTPVRPAVQSNGVSLEHSHDAAIAEAIMSAEGKGAKDEAPVPEAFSAPEVHEQPPVVSTQLAFRGKNVTPIPAMTSWSVYCNQCDKPMSNEHFHCSICDNGDYDLCSACIEEGAHCNGTDHWLLKRFVENGQVVNSTSEKIAPKQRSAVIPQEAPVPPPCAPVEEPKPAAADAYVPKRTCNSCINVLPDAEFVTCKDCEDFDLCIPCHVGSKHGHHPAHAFEPAVPGAAIGSLADFLCSPGRNVRHAAVCDGCDKYIYGVRHKCLNCPDWDFCSKCVKNSKYVHPGHRFVAIYDPLPEPRGGPVRHFGVHCDGPLCKDKNPHVYIEGVRYKCAICSDTDFCANCEATPGNRHNRTHPLIKFKTPVRNVSVSTLGENRHGAPMTVMGDQTARRSTSTETVPIPSANAATQVQTIVDLKPSEDGATKKEKIQIKDLLSEPIEENITAQAQQPTIKTETRSEPFHPSKNSVIEYTAEYVRDSVADGTTVVQGALFSQTWTMLNKGPHPWPKGCSVRYVGGDNMLNVDNNHPSSAAEINAATESNVLDRTVQVGEEVTFHILMKAPMREGTAISYWRVKAPNGMPSGHRLWCHIKVVNALSKPNENTVIDDLKAQLAALEARNQERMQGLKAAAAAVTQKSDDATILKKHVEVRAAAIANMRRAAARMDADFMKISPRAQEAQLAATQAQPGASTKPAEPKQEPKGTMIFPQLDKESPVSSTHEAFTAPQTVVAEDDAASVVSPSVKSDLDFFEDAETVDYSDNSDDGFATDEEYDILDASDQELP